MSHQNLIAKLIKRLPNSGRELLRLLIPAAQAQSLPIYLVGGPLRDLLLNRPSLDLDICTEGEAMTLADALAAHLAIRPRHHPAFGTTSLRLHGFSLDIAAARSETYRHPGALPTVRPASIHEDLRRRDFTINAMALRLDGPHAGDLLDPIGGQIDLAARRLRALHDRSFQDDATRILRACRYAARLGFTIETQTLACLRRDLHFIDTISGARLRNELSRLFAEPEPERALLHMHRLGALRAVHPALSFDEQHRNAFESLRRLAPNTLPSAAWTLLAWDLSENEAPSLSRRLALTRSQSALVVAAPALRAIETRLSVPRPSRSDLVALLSPFPLASLWALAAAAPQPIRSLCLDYLQRVRHIRPLLRGDDVLALGVPPGPQVGQALARLSAAKLNGEVKSRADEERLVQEFVAAATSALPPRPIVATAPRPARPEALEG